MFYKKIKNRGSTVNGTHPKRGIGTCSAQSSRIWSHIIIGTAKRPVSQDFASSHSPRMDPVVLLFRLIAKITMFEGVTRRPNLRVDTVQGGSVSMQHLSLLLLVSALIVNDCCRFEGMLDLDRLPSIASNIPPLSWRSFSVRSWQFMLSSHWRMLFDVTRCYGIPKIIVPMTNLSETRATSDVISITGEHNYKSLRVISLDPHFPRSVDVTPL